MLDTWTQSKNFIFKEELYVNAVIIPQHRQMHYEQNWFKQWPFCEILGKINFAEIY